MYFPHPFPLTLAQERIAKDPDKFRDGVSVDFHVCLKKENAPIGAVHIDIEQEHDRAELGYWIGKPYWNQGYATEAVAAAVQYAFETREREIRVLSDASADFPGAALTVVTGDEGGAFATKDGSRVQLIPYYEFCR